MGRSRQDAANAIEARYFASKRKRNQAILQCAAGGVNFGIEYARTQPGKGSKWIMRSEIKHMEDKNSRGGNSVIHGKKHDSTPYRPSKYMRRELNQTA
jgi:hypothetical protein